MDPEPVCTTATANNATTSIIKLNKSQETGVIFLGVCWRGSPGEGGGRDSPSGLGGEPSPARSLSVQGLLPGRGAPGTPGARPRHGEGASPAAKTWRAVRRGKESFFP